MVENKPEISTDTRDRTIRECLQKALDETQETIRAYDTKAEVLAIIMTLVVGIINFGMVAESSKTYCAIKFLSLVSILLGVFTVFTVGMVLYPRKNLFEDIDTGNERPRRTYFVSFDFMPSFKCLDEYISQVDITDWKREIAYELLKTSCIRDHKHYWFHIALKCAGATLLLILILLIGIAYHG